MRIVPPDPAQAYSATKLFATKRLPHRCTDGYWKPRSRNRRSFEGIMFGHNRKMIGAECLADMLAGYGVTHVFMVPAVLRRTFVEMERRNTKIARVHCHGEKSAAYMADGYARASRKPAARLSAPIT